MTLRRVPQEAILSNQAGRCKRLKDRAGASDAHKQARPLHGQLALVLADVH